MTDARNDCCRGDFSDGMVRHSADCRDNSLRELLTALGRIRIHCEVWGEKVPGCQALASIVLDEVKKVLP